MNNIIDNTIYGIRSIVNPLFVNDESDNDNTSDASATVDSDATTENMNNVNQNETNNVINDHEIVNEYQNTLEKQSSGLQCDKYFIRMLSILSLVLIASLIYFVIFA